MEPLFIGVILAAVLAILSLDSFAQCGQNGQIPFLTFLECPVRRVFGLMQVGVPA